MKTNHLKTVQAALIRHWPDADTARCTFTGEGDPGEWAPDADVVIHCEHGLPSPDFDTWFWTGVMIPALPGYLVEPINGCIVAVYFEG